MSEKEILEQKRKDSKKFLKIYMYTLTGVALLLIIMSYFSQTKLTDEIENLRSQVDSTEEVANTHLSNVEKLQELTIEQENLIDTFKTDIEELELLLEENTEKLQVYEDFYNLKSYIAREEYDVALPLIATLSENSDSMNEIMKAEFEVIIEDLKSLEIITEPEGE